MIHEAVQSVLNEAGAEYLNISIKNVDKVIKDSNAHKLLSQDTEVYGKYDGVKITILRTSTPWDNEKWYKNFIVAYKGNVLYGTEFQDADDSPEVLDKSVGVSQFKLIFNHIEAYWKGWKSLPTNTEFFFEFLMNKPTLTRQYTKLRELIFIGYSKVNGYTENHGKIATQPVGFFMDNREKFAKIFKVNLPELIFVGKLENLPKGLNNRAKNYWVEFAKDFNAGNDFEKWIIIRSFFLKLPSLYGSQKEEGVVFHLSSEMGGTTILKIVQDDQYDKELRGSQKAKFKMDWEDEDQYWVNVRSKAEEFIGMVDYTQPLYRTLKTLSKMIYKDWNVDINHNKKSEQNIKDDVQLTAKNMLIRMMPGNNGSLLIGKFRVVTNGHLKMFKQALKKSDKLVIAVVSNKETKKTLELRKDMVKAVVPEAEIITTTSGNLITMLNKTSTNINQIFAGSDRVKSYEGQLKRNPDVNVEEIQRTDDDESATKVIRNLGDVKYFKKNTPKKVHDFYSELVKTYGNNENFRIQGKEMIRDIIQEAKVVKPQLINDAEAWLKAKGFDFEAKDDKKHKKFKRASNSGMTELVFKNVADAKEVMALLSKTKKFKKILQSWGGYVVGLDWYILPEEPTPLTR